MELTILGSGTGLPTATRGCPGYLLDAGGALALFDTGSGTLPKLARAGVDFARVRAIFYSHFHVDHMGDLASFLFSKRIPRDDRPSSPLTIYGPRGVREIVARLMSVWPAKWTDPSGYGLQVVEVGDDDTVAIGDASVRAVSVLHTDASVAWRIESRGRVLCYSGDADVCPGLVEAARDADVFLCECSFPDDRRVAGHLTPTTAGEMADQARARRLVLTHLYPIMETIDPIAPCARVYRGDVSVGADLMRIAV